MKAVDFKLTNARDGSLSDAERSAALHAVQAALDAGADANDAEAAACRAAFATWARWPESATLEVDG